MPSQAGRHNMNPGNFANRPHEEVEEIARKGGQSSHQGGFHHMDPDKQVRGRIEFLPDHRFGMDGS